MIRQLKIERLQDLRTFVAGQNSEINTFVAPSPALADKYRSFFDGHNVETVTISAFCSNLLKQYYPDLVEGQKSKSELLMLLKAASKNYHELDYHQFKKDFNLFTNIRSYSTDKVVLKNVCELYDETTHKNLELFDQILDALGIIDEHKVYELLSLKTDVISFEQSIFFVGFEFMNGMQVDFVNKLGTHNNVNIPVYSEQLDNSTNFDWISWLEGEVVDIVDEIEDNHEKISTVELSPHTLPVYMESLASDLKKTIVLAQSNLTPDAVDEIALEDKVFKTSSELFDDIVLEVFKKFENSNVFPIETNYFIEFLKEQAREVAQREEFLKLKVISTLLLRCNEWLSLSDLCEQITYSDFKTILEITSLDLPRINYTELSREGSFRPVYSLKEIEFIENAEIEFVFMDNYSTFSSSSLSIEAIDKFLSSVGPLRRVEFDLYGLKNKIRSLVQNNNVNLVLEKDLYSRSKELSEIFPEEILNFESLNLDFTKNIIQNILAKKSSEVFSATRLQTYLDCPRKYYFQYQEKLRKDIVLQEQVNSLEIGRVEHKVIERFFNEEKSVLENIIEEELKTLFSNKKLSLSEKERVKDEVTYYGQNGIEFLKQLEADLKFELNIGQDSFTGQIDCFGETSEYKIVIDLKRSNFSFTSFSSIEEYQKIQLWFYLNRLLTSGLISQDRNVIIGYVDLSHVDNSMFFTSHKNLVGSLKELGVSKVKFLDNFWEAVQCYQKLELDIINKIRAEKMFEPTPLKAQICEFCDFKAICPKGTK